MIGVLAIMSILAAVIVPNVLKSVERAALKTEAQTMQNLGDSLRQYLKTNGALPTTVIPPGTPNWTTQLANFTQLSPSDIANTRWGPLRTYVVEPYIPPARPTRAMILSSMRTGLSVPTAVSINGSANYFNDIWQTKDGFVPSGASAGLWTAWSGTSGEYLTIQRISLSDINSTELRSFSVVLNNVHATQVVSYRLMPGGAGGTRLALNPHTSATLTPVYPNDRLELYADAVTATVNYAQQFNTGTTQPTTFRFDATLGTWTP
jgi:type II secretory pathway pseudopilin PulG